MSFIFDLAKNCARSKSVKICFDRALKEGERLLPSQAEELYQIVLGMVLEKQIDLVYQEFIRIKKC